MLRWILTRCGLLPEIVATSDDEQQPQQNLLPQDSQQHRRWQRHCGHCGNDWPQCQCTPGDLA